MNNVASAMSPKSIVNSPKASKKPKEISAIVNMSAATFGGKSHSRAPVKSLKGEHHGQPNIQYETPQ